MPSVRLCHISELPEGESRGFDPTACGRDTLFVVRQGGLHAYVDSCPHWAATPMAWRKHAYLSGDRQHIVCSAHGAQFDIRSGLCTLGPCVGQSLTPVPLTMTSDGDVHADISILTETTK